jgi:hypothetical protein
MTNSVNRCAEWTILSFLLGEGKAGRGDKVGFYLMMMPHEHLKAADWDFVSRPSFCNMRPVML